MRRVRIAGLAGLAIWGVAPLASAADLALIAPPVPHHRPVVEQRRHRDAQETSSPAQHEILLQQFLKWLHAR
jgi:hypothetical protein